MAFKKKPVEITEKKEVKSEPVITIIEQNGKPYKKITTQDNVVISVERL